MESELSNFDIARLEEVGEMLAILSAYSPEEAGEIIKAIATCRPVSEIAKLLTCSPQDIPSTQGDSDQYVGYVLLTC